LRLCAGCRRESEVRMMGNKCGGYLCEQKVEGLCEKFVGYGED
jgi:hypothetical protein